MVMVTIAAVVSRFVSHSGANAELAGSVAPEIVAGIAAYLTPAQRDLVADELPEELATEVWRVDLLATPIEERILGPSISVGRAHELVASMCRTLAEVLSIEAIDALRSSLPSELGAWLEPPSNSLDRSPRSAYTLASGRPGSSHPISEAHPDPTRTIR